jgi:anti-sigma regulatory factor (Ser/Thr protein kinase)
MQKAYQHEALPYRDREEFVSSCVAIAEEARQHDERVLFLLAAAKLDELRQALSAGADDVALVAIDQHGRNPARITTMLDSFQASASGRRCVGVNETVSTARSRAAFAEAMFAETVLNLPSVQSWPLSVICLYDTSALDSSWLTEMRRSHPVVRGEPDNPAFDPSLAAALFAQPPDDPPADAYWRVSAGVDLAATRAFIRTRANAYSLTEERLDDLVMAANEVVTNSVRHGGGQCRIGIWEDDGSVVCEVRDRGVIADPLAGRLAPAPTAPAGRGLWLANHLCDLVQIRSSQEGTVVRLYVDLVT